MNKLREMRRRNDSLSVEADGDGGEWIEWTWVGDGDLWIVKTQIDDDDDNRDW
jgi:hypothetical protein